MESRGDLSGQQLREHRGMSATSLLRSVLAWCWKTSLTSCLNLQWTPFPRALVGHISTSPVRTEQFCLGSHLHRYDFLEAKQFFCSINYNIILENIVQISFVSLKNLCKDRGWKVTSLWLHGPGLPGSVTTHRGIVQWDDRLWHPTAL